jgi:hypothetical protein
MVGTAVVNSTDLSLVAAMDLTTGAVVTGPVVFDFFWMKLVLIQILIALVFHKMNDLRWRRKF